MRPLGLEGKVGAPAIVRTNPLLRKYDTEFVPAFYGRSVKYDQRIVESFSPFSWYDVLGVVSERYAGSADDVLSSFLSLCCDTLSDPVLVYDLETPRLSVRMGWSGGRSPLGVLRGSCGTFGCGLGLVCGDSILVDVSVGAVVLSPANAFRLNNSSFGLYDPSSPCEDTFVWSLSDSALCTGTPVDYEANPQGAIGGPGDFAGLGHPDRSLLGLVDDPLRLRSGLIAVASSLKAWCSTPEYVSLRDRMGADPRSSSAQSGHHFTPRGGSR